MNKMGCLNDQSVANSDINTSASNLPKICLGAWAWGNDGTFGNQLTPESLKPIFDKAMEKGLNLWDTAFAYGMGTS